MSRTGRGIVRSVAVVALVLLAGCSTTVSTTSGPISDPQFTPKPETLDATRRVEVRMELATGYFQRGQFDIALEEVKRALDINPNLGAAHNLRGLILYTAGEPANALEEYRRTLAINAYFTDAHNNAGAALAALGRHEEALAEFKLVLKDPRYPAREKVFVNMADVHATQGRWEEAVADYRRALVAKPDYVSAHFKLGKALLELGRPGEARQAFDEVVRLRPHSDEAREVKQLLASSPASS